RQDRSGPPAMSETPLFRSLATPDLLTDESARESFKAAHRASRRDLDAHPFVQLDRRAEVPAVDPGRRRSERIFASRPVSFADLSALLSALASESTPEGPTRRYPSAGGAYPVQAYVHVESDRVEGVPPGAYYVDPDRRRLALVSDQAMLGAADHFAS